jgi:hypothetical protein
MSNKTKQKRRAVSGKKRTVVVPRNSFMLSQTSYGDLVAWFEQVIDAPMIDVDADGDVAVVSNFGASKVWEWIEVATDAADVYNLRELGAPLCVGALTLVKLGLKQGQALPVAAYRAAHGELCAIMVAVGLLKNRVQIGLGETVKGRIYAQVAQAAQSVQSLSGAA